MCAARNSRFVCPLRASDFLQVRGGHVPKLRNQNERDQGAERAQGDARIGRTPHGRSSVPGQHYSVPSRPLGSLSNRFVDRFGA